ncbi:MAG: hypothetical protein ACJATS_001375, partial [Psychroserpens sp.]
PMHLSKSAIAPGMSPACAFVIAVLNREAASWLNEETDSNKPVRRHAIFMENSLIFS